jgi:hypothetical protein
MEKVADSIDFIEARELNHLKNAEISWNGSFEVLLPTFNTKK